MAISADPEDDDPPLVENATAKASSPFCVPALKNGMRRPEVEVELEQWYALGGAEQLLELRATVNGKRSLCSESLIHITTAFHRAGNRRGLNLAFEALSHVAAPLLLSQAFGQARDEKLEQVQEILLEAFKVIRSDAAEYLEVNFASFAKRKAVTLYQKRKRQFEHKHDRLEGFDDADPLDDVPDRQPSQEAKAALSLLLDQLPSDLRQVFIQYHVMQLTYEEIAQQQKVDESTVRKWLKRAAVIVSLDGGKE